MKTLICVPSKGRATLFAKKTLKVLEHTETPFRVFVEPQEIEVYAAVMPRLNLVSIGEANQGLGYALNFIREYALSRDIQMVWKMDDDVHNWYDCPRVKPKKRQAEALDDCVRNVARIKKRVGDSLAGISFGNKFFHTYADGYSHVGKMFETTYMVDPTCWLTPLATRGYHEEFVASAHIITQGKLSLRYAALAWDADLSIASGGLQSFDRVKEQRKYFAVLAKAHPELMHLTEAKEYAQKTGKVFTVTDKTLFNKRCSCRLPLKAKDRQRLSDGPLLALTTLGLTTP